jgi:hypothetical protein
MQNRFIMVIAFRLKLSDAQLFLYVSHASALRARPHAGAGAKISVGHVSNPLFHVGCLLIDSPLCYTYASISIPGLFQ